MKRSTVAAFVAGAILALTWGSAVAAAQEPDGAALYRQSCRTCHGARGTPPARMTAIYPELKTIGDSAFAARMSTDAIVGVLQHGKGKDMKPFAEKLSAAEMLAVAKYVRTLASAAP
jgi:mono/diheme cytochrome c family protein